MNAFYEHYKDSIRFPIYRRDSYPPLEPVAYDGAPCSPCPPDCHARFLPTPLFHK
jgi:hypothetical protein